MSGLREDVVLAAGGIVRLRSHDRDCVAVVHRPRYDDWSLPKGKLGDDESWIEAAVREVKEETGAQPELGDFAGVVSYSQNGDPKIVLFWHMTVKDAGTFTPSDEVDAVEWLPLPEAVARLSYANQRRLLVESALESGDAWHAERRRRHRAGWARFKPGRWFRAESARRLRAELEFNRIELEHLIGTTLQGSKAAPPPWAVAARTLYEAARADLEEGRVDDGWRAFHAAQRMGFEGLAKLDDAEGLRACARAVLNEAAKKLTGWRKATIEELIGKPEKLSTSPADVFKVSLSAKVLHEHFSNLYLQVEGLRRQIAWLVGAGLAAVFLWLKFGLESIEGVTSSAEASVGIQPDLVPSVMLFGAMGGAVSGILSLAKKSRREKIPEQLVSAWFTLSRPLVGAVTAVVVYIALMSGLLGLDQASTEVTLLSAFAAGFSERLLERAVGAASGPPES